MEGDFSTNITRERKDEQTCELEIECEIQAEIRSPSRDDMDVFAHQDRCI